MSKNVWFAAVSLGLIACGGMGEEPPPTIEQRRQQVRDCLLQYLPRPEGVQEWEVSGYVLVEAYRQCQKAPGEATAADFRAVIQGLASHVEGDASRVRIILAAGGSS